MHWESYVAWWCHTSDNICIHKTNIKCLFKIWENLRSNIVILFNQNHSKFINYFLYFMMILADSARWLDAAFEKPISFERFAHISYWFESCSATSWLNERWTGKGKYYASNWNIPDFRPGSSMKPSECLVCHLCKLNLQNC